MWEEDPGPVGLSRGCELRPRRSWESWEAPGSLGREPCNLAEHLIWLHWVLLEGGREESPRCCATGLEPMLHNKRIHNNEKPTHCS